MDLFRCAKGLSASLSLAFPCAASALTCEVKDVDKSIARYAQKACKIVQSRESRYTGGNKTFSAILSKSQLVFVGRGSAFFGLHNLDTGPYKVEAKDPGRPTSFYTLEITPIGFALRDFRYEMAKAAEAEGDQRARDIYLSPLRTELYSLKTQESLVIELSNAGQTSGFVQYIPRSEEVFNVGAASIREVALNKTRNTNMQGISYLTPAGMAAKFLGLKY